MSDYRIQRLIGIGGAAAVYEATPLRAGGDGASMACKLMREDHRAVAEARALVRQEAALGLRVTPGHPNLVQVLEYIEDAGEGPCIVMELVAGGSLKALLGSGPRLPLPCTRRIAREVLQALAYLHEQDVLHRDLSPCNILISTSGSVKVTDLGIARVMQQGHTHTRNYRGKLVYDSPEAIQTLPLDARSDLYTLAAVLYELLAGTPPCGETEVFAEIVIRTLRGDFAPLPPDAPADLAELVTGLLRPEREDREPQTATGALALLRRHDQPVASAAELGALVLAMKSRRGDEPDDAHRAPTLAPGEMLEPGDVLVARTDVQPDALLPAAVLARPATESLRASERPAAAPPRVAESPAAEPPPAAGQLPEFPLPAEPPLPPLPQPRPRITATLTRASAPARRPQPSKPAGGASVSRLRRDAVYRALGGALLLFCVVVSGVLLLDRSRRLRVESNAGDPAPRSEVPVPVVVPAPAPPVQPSPELPESTKTDQTTRSRSGRSRQHVDGPSPTRTGAKRPARRPRHGELRWEPVPRLASEPPRWGMQ